MPPLLSNDPSVLAGGEHWQILTLHRLHFAEQRAYLEANKQAPIIVNLVGWDRTPWKPSQIEGLTSIRGLRITENSCEGLSWLSGLSNLEVLKCEDPQCRLIDLAEFSKLKHLTASWKNRPRNLDKLPDVTGLSLSNFSEASLEPLRIFPRLQNLELALTTISDFDELKHFRLSNLTISHATQLSSLEGVRSQAATLTELSLRVSKKISDRGDIASLASLRSLTVHDCGRLPTIRFVERMKDLRALDVGLTNIEDGRLAFLRDCEWLKNINFTNKKHYDAKIESFPNWGYWLVNPTEFAEYQKRKGA